MTQIMIYGCIGDEFCGLDAATLVPLITGGTDALEIRINSGGGNIVEGLAIYNAMTRAVAQGREVKVFIDGLAASMASVIAMGGSSIAIAENALIMIHNPWDWIDGDAAALRSHADRLDLLKAQIVDIYAKRTGQTPDALGAMMDAETWLPSDDALTLGFVTEIVPAVQAVNSVNVSKFGFRKVPDHPLVSAVAASIPPAAAAVTPKENVMTEPVATPAALTPADVTNASNAATEAEQGRILAIDGLFAQHGSRLGTAAAVATMRNELVTSKATIDAARAKVLDILATASDSLQIGHTGPMVVTRDERDKWLTGASNWILQASGNASLVTAAAKLRGDKVDLDPGEFRGVKMVQLASEFLARAGINPGSRNPDAIVGAAFTARNAVTQGTGDFSVLLENTMHKTLQAAYMVAPDTWTRFCGIGSVTDFRAHKRYLLGSFGALDTVNENGEFKNRAVPEGARESITATTKGNTINLTRQAIINDDLGAFMSLAVQLGRAAKLSIESDVYALLLANPNMGDGIPLFHASHGNLVAAGAGTPPTVAAVDAMRQAMASQRDVSGNDYLDIKPDVAVLPIGLGGAMRVVNGSQYDPASAGVLQKVNIALGIFSDIVDTPRLAGTAWYGFANKDSAPAIEVAFLNGVTEPYLESRLGWSVDGTEWKVREDYGVAAVNWRSAQKNAGA